uniref:Uncharacterized protein n=1 Tax=Tanacetum cinerariifolium TaxID=118510 RepID=A0A699GV55_TANCI|nr:hypothetical protein [Tanacetum cinerariifolium]
MDDVVNDDDQPQDDSAPRKDNFTSFKQPPRPETPDLERNQDKDVDEGPEQTWLTDLAITKKPPLTFDDPLSTPIYFSASFIELEYNIDQCYLALTNQLDREKPKGKRCPYDLSKPLPLKGCPGHLTIPVDRYFNNDLEFFKIGNTERKYTTLITKTKAARYELVDKKFGYGYLEEIVVRRVDHKLYTFKECDFKNLHLNDIKDMLILHVQNMISNLEGHAIVELAVALRMFTRSQVIKRRVEDVQLAVKNYQKKLNITKPQKDFDGISYKEPYTSTCDPKGAELQIGVQLRHAKTKIDSQRSESVTNHGELDQQPKIEKTNHAKLEMIGWCKESRD